MRLSHAGRGGENPLNTQDEANGRQRLETLSAGHWGEVLVRCALALIFGVVLVLGVALSPTTAQAQSTDRVVDYYGGHCRICGGQTYACSNGHGTWNSGQRTFSDPVPSGYKMTRVIYYIQGVNGCRGSSSNIQGRLNGYYFGQTYAAGGCSCNGCDSQRSISSSTFSNGFPNYRYRTTNTVQLTFTSGLGCVANVRVRLYYTRSTVTCYRDADGDGYGNRNSTSQRSSCSGGWVSNSSDCNDSNRNIRPGAREVCNNADDDCDGSVDEGVRTTFYYDYDNDGYGTSSSQSRCSASGYYRARNAGDCNDRNGGIRPGATEICDNIDNNCAGGIDEGFTHRYYYYDADNDTYGTSSRIYECKAYGLHRATRSGDCNDGNSSINPGRTEVCNGVDDNCRNGVDEGVRTTFYYDYDNDGYGTSSSQSRCSASGYYRARRAGDCNDRNSSIRPGVSEVCDNIDNDCDGSIDEGITHRYYYRDDDNDTYGTSSRQYECKAYGVYRATRSGDCNDGNSNINPGRTEVCNGVDDNCRNGVDEGLRTTYYLDADNDGYGTSSSQSLCAASGNYRATRSGDCNDGNSNINPGRAEVCNGIDDNCAGGVDDGLATRRYYFDGDSDGYGRQGGGTGTYTVQNVSGANMEQPGRTISLSDDQMSGAIGIGFTFQFFEQNYSNIYISSNGFISFLSGQSQGCCSGQRIPSSGNPNAIIAGYWEDLNPVYGGAIRYGTLGSAPNRRFIVRYQDIQHYGRGNTTDFEIVLFEGSNNVEIRHRYSPSDGGTHSVGIENSSGSQGYQTYYGSVTLSNRTIRYTPSANQSIVRCGPTGSYTSTNNTDCDDTRSNVRPGLAEVCGDNLDNNCNGSIDENKVTFYRDSDGDSYGNSSSTRLECTRPSGYATRGGDCNDGNNAINPGATEICDNIDNNCAGGVDEGIAHRNYYTDVDNDGYGVGSPRSECKAYGTLRATRAGDCNDGNANINPGRTEVCNGIDDDCNDGVDEGLRTTFYLDADNDTYGTSSSQSLCAASGNFRATRSGDCNDGNGNINPGRAEVCNGIDDNCRNGVDEGLATSTFYLDADDDTYGLSNNTITRCGPTGDYTATRGGDCNDGSGSVNPGRAEICGNNIDDNCAGGIDENKVTFYRDADGDNYGNNGNSRRECTRPSGYVTDNTDCNDGEGAINPGATEVCDNVDNNCAGGIDEGFTHRNYYTDVDNDGYGVGSPRSECKAYGTLRATRAGDCNDGNANVNPGRTEVCNGIDDDCNDGVDEGLRTTFYLDADNDGYGTSSSQSLCAASGNFRATRSGDCNDGNGNINPGATEVCNGVDDNCAGGVDDGLTTRRYYRDSDDDTYGTNDFITRCGGTGVYTATRAGDCDDSRNNVRPGLAEVCGDNLDNNCNGSVDENKVTFYRDADSDGFGNVNSTRLECTQPSGYVTNSTDCDDSAGGVNPDATEVCDNVDNNCAGGIDEGFTHRDYFNDVDGDGYGVGSARSECRAYGTFRATQAGDCDDSNGNVNPGEAEICGNNIDDNCAGGIDENKVTVYRDRDSDNFGNANDTTLACVDNVPNGYVRDNTDCDDTRDNVRPGGTEVCDGLDNNCAGGVDEGLATSTFFLDADDDSYGLSNNSIVRCGPTGDYTATQGNDCNDTNGDVNPGEAEICGNNIDDNCAGGIDENKVTFYRDSDNDGFGNNGVTALACAGQPPAGYVANNTDCDDSRGNVRPGGTEVCDLLDNDCDGSIDEGLPTLEYFTDADNDTYGTGTSRTLCGARGLFRATRGGDCNDSSSSVNPGVAEICGNNIDDNCAGGIDENKLTFYRDSDGDNFGNLNDPTRACTQPSGYVANSTDCDDTRDNVRPGGTEVCDGLDNDCAGGVDDGLATSTFFLDADDDGYGLSNNSIVRCGPTGDYTATQGNDCNDTNGDVNPGEAEVCGNNIDDNCVGGVDENKVTFYRDEDGDNFGDNDVTTRACAGQAPNGYVSDNTDCDDARDNVRPGGTEVCDGLDNDCAGGVDDGLATRDYFLDVDDDGFGLSSKINRCGPQGNFRATQSGDCNDNNGDVNPDAAEICGNEIDDNCAGGVDENKVTFYRDADGDNFGDVNNTALECTQPTGYVSNSTDCDDTRDNVRPGGTEVCDGLDNDCAGGVDDGLNTSTFFFDGDDDDFGLSSRSIVRCGPIGDFTATQGNDCDDTNGNVNPDAAEICGNNIDDNCVGGVDENKLTFYRDEDDDGVGNTNNTTRACAGQTPTGYVSTNGDCNDNNAQVKPGLSEVCDDLDNDCNGSVDDGLQTFTFHLDVDDDTFGTDSTLVRCAARGDFTASRGGDCNDNNGNVNPDAAEVCGNDIDDNCADGVDENEVTFYRDEDGDDFGNPDVTLVACTQPAGYVLNNTDCNDLLDSSFPGNQEVCDEVDNDCDGQVNEGLDVTAYFLDVDNDGFGVGDSVDRCGPLGNLRATQGGDCNDNNEDINPGAAEICGNSVDDNCNDQVDENLVTYYRDQDNDNFGDPQSSTRACSQPTGYTQNNTDCDDSNETVNPNGTELCDGVDNNCNDEVDEDIVTRRFYLDADDDTYGIENNFIERCAAEGDYTAIRGGDCNDSNGNVNPGAAEICGNSVDDNCNDEVDENRQVYYRDEDGDDFGDSNNVVRSCTQPTGYVTVGGDCDDDEDGANPDADEICDGIDNDCDGQQDEGLLVTRFRDNDEDGYGTTEAQVCPDTPRFATVGRDCNDGNADINPGETEVCNNVDDNCDGRTDENLLVTRFRDDDGDTYGAAEVQTCPQFDGFATRGGDCNDGSAISYPGATELCDQLDNNCNNEIDEAPGGGDVCASSSPVITQLDDISVSTDDCNGTGVTLPTPSVFDDNDPNPQLRNNAPNVFPIGRTTVLWEATDSDGEVGTMGHVVTVSYSGAPSIPTLDAVTVEATSPAGTPVSLNTPNATICLPGDVTVTSNAPARFPLGATTVTWTATHPNATGTATATQTVTVRDTTAPTIEAGDDLTFVDPAPVVIPRPAVSDNATASADIQVTDDRPDTFPANTFVTVTFTATDGSNNSSTDTVRVYRQVGNVQPPVISNVNPSEVWHSTMQTFTATIEDAGCTDAPTISFQPTSLSVQLQEVQPGQWTLSGTTQVPGVVRATMNVTSACTNLSASKVHQFGADPVAPILLYSGVSQSGVDPDDISTWPGLVDSGKLRMTVLMRDLHSGLATLDVDMELGDGTTIKLFDGDFDDRRNTPPTGDNLRSEEACDNETYCSEGGELELSALVGTSAVMTITVTDVAGNSTVRDYRFRLMGLRPSIVAWKAAIEAASTDDPQASTALSNAADKLQLALVGYDTEHWGNMVLALEDSLQQQAVARLFDSGLDFSTEALTTADLAHLFFVSMESDYRDNHLNEESRPSFEKTSLFLQRADTAIGVAAAADAMLALANAWFWMEEGRERLLGTGCVEAFRVMSLMMDDMGAYVGDERELPGQAEVGLAYSDLQPVSQLFERFVRFDCGINGLTDLEHVEVMIGLTNAAEALKDSEETTAWIRTWQWGLTNIVYYFAERDLLVARSFLGDQHPIIVEGQSQLDRAITLREEFRADDFMQVLIESRCLIVTLYNRIFSPDTDVPLACCEATVAYNELDSRVVVPDFCE